MFRETAILFVVVLGSIKILYQFRGVAIIGKYLSTWVAALLIYPATLYTTFRKLPDSFFEKGLPAIVRSAYFFAAASVIIFPAFLILNHFYQRLFFGRTLDLSSLEITTQTVLIQIALVAFPEEFFFRGYLQSAIARRYPKKLHLFGIQKLSIGWAVPITSFLFALSHSFIALRWWHFAIFFPSLIFGWLREKTKGLIAPILFHATSNIVVALINTAYR